jgi:hypothetical protein
MDGFAKCSRSRRSNSPDRIFCENILPDEPVCQPLEALWTNSPTDVFEAPYTSADRLADIGTLLEPSGRLSFFRDVPDNRILECAVEGTADDIVTGDKAMLAIGGYERIRLITLADYLDQSGRSR